jgi:hypothetical protein
VGIEGRAGQSFRAERRRFCFAKKARRLDRRAALIMLAGDAEAQLGGCRRERDRAALLDRRREVVGPHVDGLAHAGVRFVD